MGYCAYCGKSAGLLRSKHKSCEERGIAGYRKMVEIATQAASRSDFEKKSTAAKLN